LLLLLLFFLFFCVIVRSLNNETRKRNKEKEWRPHRLAAVRDTVTDTPKNARQGFFFLPRQ
jgi:hypothetical protein